MNNSFTNRQILHRQYPSKSGQPRYVLFMTALCFALLNNTSSSPGSSKPISRTLRILPACSTRLSKCCRSWNTFAVKREVRSESALLNSVWSSMRPFEGWALQVQDTGSGSLHPPQDMLHKVLSGWPLGLADRKRDPCI